MILPASTVPTDITVAARFLDTNGDNSAVDDQPWDDSVKGLAKYPDVLKWMDQNLEWTQSLGEAFVEQPADVMDAIQQLRAKARAAGNLVDTPQQEVETTQDNSIEIVPTDPQVIYVPQYDPEIVYVQSPAPNYGPLITFGAGCAAGAWLSYDFNWHQRYLYHGNVYGRRDNIVVNNVNVTNSTTNVYRWKPSANSVRQVNLRQHKNLGNASIARAHANNVVNANTNTAVTNAGTVVHHPARVPKPESQVRPRTEHAPQANGQNLLPGDHPKHSQVRVNDPATRAPQIPASELPRQHVNHEPVNREPAVRQPQQQPPQIQQQPPQQQHIQQPQHERPTAAPQIHPSGNGNGNGNAGNGNGGNHGQHGDGKKKKKDKDN